MDNPAVYRATRDRIIELVSGHDRDGDPVVLACPDWSVRDVVAHLAGVCDDITAGNLAGTGTDPWTADQVRKRTDRPLADIIEEWRTLSEKALALMGDAVPDQLIFDEVTHEHDLRAALGRPGERDNEAVAVALQFLGPVLQAVLGATAPLTIRSDHQEWKADDAAATLTASDFDLMRSGSGRRTRDQVASLDWGGADPAPWLPAFYFEPFREPLSPVEESGPAA